MKNIAHTILVCVTLTALQSNAAIVFQDNFDNDGLATNTGIGGGLAARTIQSAVFNDTGNLVQTAGGVDGGNRGVISTVNSYDLSGGFTLDVTMTGGTTAILQSFGMSTAQFSSDTNSENWLTDQAWAGQSATHARYGIGVNTGGAFNDRGLKFNNGGASGLTGLSVTADQIVNGATGSVTFSLTVTPDDQFSYSYNGGPAVTGEIIAGPGSFDLSQELYFNIYSQSNIGVESVTLTAIPEPSSAMLLGFSSLLLLRRRR